MGKEKEARNNYEQASISIRHAFILWIGVIIVATLIILTIYYPAVGVSLLIFFGGMYIFVFFMLLIRKGMRGDFRKKQPPTPNV
jgi:hypothetical protein